jgi:cell division protein FtsB
MSNATRQGVNSAYWKDRYLKAEKTLKKLRAESKKLCAEIAELRAEAKRFTRTDE